MSHEPAIFHMRKEWITRAFSDEQVSMLLSEAEVGWPMGLLDVWPEGHQDEFRAVFRNENWDLLDESEGRCEKFLAVLVSHGLVRCGECGGDGEVNEDRAAGRVVACISCGATGCAR